MNLFFEIVKLIVELLIIILVSKNLLVPIIRKLGEKLKLKPHTIGNIAGIATSIPEFLTVTFSAVNGMLDTGIFNILSSNISNTIQYTISILLNKNVNLLKNRVIKINMILVLLTIIIPIIVWKLQIMDNIIIVPIFIILFYIFNKINIISHKGIENEKEVEERQFKNKKIYVYAIYILLIGIILYLNTYKQADYKFTTKYWKYALVLSIPLLPHYLSIKILNQVDRVMITQMVGLSETGLYNLACTVSNLMIIATDAINRSMCPYVYKSIKNKNILPVRKMTSSVLLVVMVVSFLEMLIAPELIKIFATDDYLDAIYVIPPVAMSIYFIFLYVVFANVEFYFEKTIFATIVSGIAAVMNIGMNYIFLKKYGYYAAGYTTLICYMLFALLHYWNYKRILKREPYLNGIFDIRHVLLISFSLVIIIITISFYFRNQLKSIIKTSNN